jgi:hypothetical protein
MNPCGGTNDLRHRGVCVRGRAGGDRRCGRGDGLTVFELIAALSEMPHDAVVWLEIRYCDGEKHQTALDDIDPDESEIYLCGRPK